jgi:hypothetical protein
MPASTRKQLNVRSNEAYSTAHKLARQLGTTATEVVVRALREFNSNHPIPSRLVTPEEAAANLSALMASIRARAPNRSAALASNYDDLYDEFGLPK